MRPPKPLARAAKPKVKKLTEVQTAILRNLRDGRYALYGAYGLQQHGGWSRSMTFLQAAALLEWDQQADRWKLSELGETALAEGKFTTVPGSQPWVTPIGPTPSRY